MNNLRLGANPRPSRPRRRVGPSRRQPTRQRRPLHELWHPMMHTGTWVPSSLRTTPTLRVHDQVTFELNAIAVEDTVCLINPMMINDTSADDGDLSTRFIGVTGSGIQAGTAGTVISTGTMASAPPGRYRLHRLAVTLACTGPSAGGALIPSTFAKIGVLRATLDPNTFTTFATISAFLAQRSELHMATAWDLMTHPRHIASYPLDYLMWQQLKKSVNGVVAVANLAPTDDMCTIAIALAHTTTALAVERYIVTVHMEWDCLPSDDAGSAAMVASAIVQQPSLSDDIVHGAIAAAQTVQGVFEKGELVAAGVNKAVEAVRGFTTALPRPVSALLGRGLPALMNV